MNGELLFVYGTLRLPHVQEFVVGRRVSGRGAHLPGWRLQQLSIADPSVVGVSGEAVHPIAVPDPDAIEGVAGSVLELSPEELARVDGYEVGDYERVRVRLNDGTRVWFYAARS